MSRATDVRQQVASLERGVMEDGNVNGFYTVAALGLIAVMLADVADAIDELREVRR